MQKALFRAINGRDWVNRFLCDFHNGIAIASTFDSYYRFQEINICIHRKYKFLSYFFFFFNELLERCDTDSDLNINTYPW